MELGLRPRQILAAKLRGLCATRPSISYVCRDLGLNRQQFGKYLAGTTLPTTITLNRIAVYFDVPMSWLLVEGNDNTQNAADGVLGTIEGMSPPYPIQNPSNNIALAQNYLKEMEALSHKGNNWPSDGYYLSYNPSFATSDEETVLVCVARLLRSGNQMFYRRKLLCREGDKELGRCINYYGIGHLNNENLFIRYVDVCNLDGFGSLILRPFKYYSSDLYGVHMAIAATRYSEPASSKIYFEYHGEKPNLRHLFQKCGLRDMGDFSSDNPSIDWLRSQKDDSSSVIRAL